MKSKKKTDDDHVCYWTEQWDMFYDFISPLNVTSALI